MPLTPKIKGYIFNSLRKIFRWYPEKAVALKRQQRGPDKYECEKCNQLFSRKEVHIDHLIPVVDPRAGFISFDEYIERLYCNGDNLQVLCVKDHKIKTKAENALRKKYKQAKEKRNVGDTENSNSSNDSTEGSGSTKKPRRSRKKV